MHDIFLKIDGILGGSQDAQHPEEIEISHWHWHITRFESEGVTPRRQGGDLEFTHRIDRASPALAKYCRTAQRIPKAVLSSCYAGGVRREFLRLTLFDVLVTSVTPNVDAYGATETARLSFVRVNHEYIMHKPTGERSGMAMAMLDMQR